MSWEPAIFLNPWSASYSDRRGIVALECRLDGLLGDLDPKGFRRWLVTFPKQWMRASHDCKNWGPSDVTK